MIVTRFAPSPTGHLHIGVARTALFCWAFARNATESGQQGRFVLRIEDTDQRRSSDDSVTGILDDLSWLGMDWDDGPQHGEIGGDAREVGPYYQSQRLGIYDDYIQRLVDSGHAYAAFETPEQLEAKRKNSGDRGYKYDRAALTIPAAERQQRVEAGEPHVIRFKMPDEEITLADVVVGKVVFPAQDLEDFVIRKRDGFPTYHLAVVVDDELMGVTHVLRGQEHVSNTPKHLALQQALGFATPTYGHLPIIFNPDGSKMSKRDKDKVVRAACKSARKQGIEFSPGDQVTAADLEKWLKDKQRQLPPDALQRIARTLDVKLPEVDIEDFRKAGYLPEALCNFIALLGWNPKQKDDSGNDVEHFDTDFLCRNFRLQNIGKANAKFDRAKLLSFNADWINELDDDAFVQRWRDWADSEDPELNQRLDHSQMLQLASAVKRRCKTLSDGRELISFVMVGDDELTYDAKAVAKHVTDAAIEMLARISSALSELAPFNASQIDELLANVAEETEVGMGKIAQPLRVAVSGSQVSPPIGATLEVLGKDSVIRRINRCIACAQQSLSQ